MLFFVSVGMLFDARHLLRAPGIVAGALAVILVVKPLAAMAVVRMLGQPSRTAAAVAAALGQIGEFSFILAAAGRSLGLLDDSAVQTIVAAAILSITISPMAYRLRGPAEGLLRRIAGEPEVQGSGDAPGEEPSPDRDRVVVVGCGPVGRTLVRLLGENRFRPVVVELNLETVRRLSGEGTAAVYGDASHRQTLEQAGLPGAVALVFSSSQIAGIAESIRLARELNPRALIAARANYLAELPALRDAGADLVFAGEGEVALSMTGTLLERLGATPEQVDRERDRVRSELFERPGPPSSGK